MKSTQRITSRDNQKLKFARKVREGKTDDAIFVEGVRLAEEALRSDLTIIECFISTGFGNAARERELVDQISASGVEINETSETLFNTIADTKQPQGIVLIGERPESSRVSFEHAIAGTSPKLPIIVFLHEVNNPSNLGAIIRTAEAAGILGVVVSELSADVFSPKASRAAMGSSFRVPIWENADFDEALSWAKAVCITTTAADINAGKSYADVDWKTNRMLVFGSEASGLIPEYRERIEDLILIPMESGVESLNLAVSCGIILFEAKRQDSAK